MSPPASIDALYGRLRRGDGAVRPLAAATVARIHVVVSSAFSQAMRWGWVWDNPASRSHRIVVPTKEMRPPTPRELKTLLDYVSSRDPQLQLLLILAAVTGERRAQLLGLRWHNVSLATRRIAFCAGWVEGPNGPVLAPTKTKRRHVVDLDVESCYLLADHAAGASAGLSRDAFIFSDDGGATAWKPNRVTKAFVRHRRAAGLAPFCLHDSAISWRQRCSTLAYRSLSFHADSTTRGSQQRWTDTPTPSPDRTSKHPQSSGKS